MTHLVMGRSDTLPPRPWDYYRRIEEAARAFVAACAMGGGEPLTDEKLAVMDLKFSDLEKALGIAR